MIATPYAHLDDLAMLGLAGWLVLRADPPAWAWVIVLAGALVIEGEPIWGPGPVIALQVLALVLLSAAALTRAPAPAVPQPEGGRFRQPTTPR